MNCREFTEEFEERRSALSQPAQLHLNDCHGCKTTSGRQTRVWQMIDGLKRVDAPHDFDFRVRAKVAGAKSSDFQTHGFLPALRYVLPLCLVALVLGLLAFNTSFFFGSNNAPSIAGAGIQQTSEPKIAPVNSFASNEIASAEAERETPSANNSDFSVERIEDGRRKPAAIAKLPPKLRTDAPKKNVKDDFVGVRDLALSKPAEKFPIGINPNQSIKTPPNITDSNSVGAEEVLRFLGIEAVAESGNFKVKVVRENSSAERSDAKVGDVIEAIDGVKLSAESPRAKQVEVKNITVRRGAEKIEITLKN